jgi:hypothetical protein
MQVSHSKEHDVRNAKLMPTGSLAKLYERAVELGWRCVSSTWRGHQTSYEFECTRGHRFERRATTVLYESPSCPGYKPHTLPLSAAAQRSERTDHRLAATADRQSHNLGFGRCF